VLGLTLCLLAPMVADAKSQSMNRTRGKKGSAWTREATWTSRAQGKLLFGTKNLLLGWTEVLAEPYDAVQRGGNVFTGLGQGLWNGIGQTVGGALHVATFPMTELDIPLPEGGTKVF